MTRNERITEIAMRIYPKCIETIEFILKRGQSCEENLPQTAAAKMAVRYAAELDKQLHAFEHMYGEERKNF